MIVNHSVEPLDSFAIEAKGLVKVFGNHRAVDGVDLMVQKGSVYGFLGPNGAGKTTTIRMLATLLQPDDGYAKIFGYDLVSETRAIRNHISLTGQYASLDEDLTGFENLVMISRLLGYSRKQAKGRVNELLTAFELEEVAHRQVKNYSGGMRRRIDIVASIVATPKLLFLDEPTTGLDPRSRNLVWDIVKTLANVGTTVLLTTQYLEEADKLADRIAVINQGKIIAEGTSSELKTLVGEGILNIRLSNSKDCEIATNVLTHLGVTIHPSSDSSLLSAQINNSSKAINIFSELSRQDISVSSFSYGQPSLDEVFLTLTGQPVKKESTSKEVSS